MLAVGQGGAQPRPRVQVGYDQYSYGVRDLEGCKVRQALREPYGAPFREGDLVGCLLYLPPGGAALSVQPKVPPRSA